MRKYSFQQNIAQLQHHRYTIQVNIGCLADIVRNGVTNIFCCCCI